MHVGPVGYVVGVKYINCMGRMSRQRLVGNYFQDIAKWSDLVPFFCNVKRGVVRFLRRCAYAWVDFSRVQTCRRHTQNSCADEVSALHFQSSLGSHLRHWTSDSQFTGCEELLGLPPGGRKNIVCWGLRRLVE